MDHVQRLAHLSDEDFTALGALLVDAVEHGASVNFVTPPTPDAATQWWRDATRETGTHLFVSRDARGRIVGCVRLMQAHQPNGTHRAEVGKLLVHSGAQRQGRATALMAAVEALAAELGITLLILDTETGSYAERFYERHGWTAFGVLPNHLSLIHI